MLLGWLFRGHGNTNRCHLLPLSTNGMPGSRSRDHSQPSDVETQTGAICCPGSDAGETDLDDLLIFNWAYVISTEEGMLSNSENTTSKGNSKSCFWSLPKLGHFSCSNELQPHTGAEPGSSEARHNVTLSSSLVNLLAVSEKSKDCDNYQLSWPRAH